MKSEAIATPENGTGNSQAGAPAKPAKLDLTKLSYEEIVKLSVDQQDALMKGFNSTVKRINDSKDEFKTESKHAAVLLAAIEQRVKRGIDARIYPTTKTASDLYKDVTGAKPPGHVWTLKNSFVNYVLSGLVPEAEWLLNRGNCLELAQRIVDAVIEHDPETGLKHDAVTRAAAELKTRGENEAKTLRAILASVKPAADASEEDTLKAVQGMNITPTIALAMFHAICFSGNLPPCLAQMVDYFGPAEEGKPAKMTDQNQKEAYIALFRKLQAVEAAVDDNLTAWADETATQPIRFVQGETLAPENAPVEQPIQLAEAAAA